MKHLGTRNLKTSRLYLRRFKVSDAQMVYDNWSSDEEVTRYVTWPAHKDIITTKRILMDWQLYYQSPNAFHRRGMRHQCELGYCLSKHYWNKGLMTEAASRVLEFAFKEIGVDSVIAKHDVRNVASGRVMQKLGMTHDKLVTRAVLNGKGEWVDCDTYIIFKHEFSHFR